jgi:hypothetical protein
MFGMDGVRQAWWSGESDWVYEIFPVSAGEHDIFWGFNRFDYENTPYNCGWIDNILITGIETGINQSCAIPKETELYQNYPNPFNNETMISFTIDEVSLVELSVYNSKGEFVSYIVKKRYGKGTHKVNFKADGLSSGIYYYCLKANGDMKQTKKMLYLR